MSVENNFAIFCQSLASGRTSMNKAKLKFILSTIESVNFNGIPYTASIVAQILLFYSMKYDFHSQTSTNSEWCSIINFVLKKTSAQPNLSPKRKP